MPPPRFEASGTRPNGRLTVYADPVPGMTYSLGLDFALGIPGKDFDAGVLLDTDGKQAATLHGHWGTDFTPHVRELVQGFGGSSRVFVVGEASATGLGILRDLYDEGHWCYFHRATETRGRVQRDKLGHVPQKMDITVQWLREAIRTRKVVIRDEELHRECCKFGFRPRGSRTPEEATDADLVWGAPPGEHDDLVRAAALAWAGTHWLPQFEPPKHEYPADSIAKFLGLVHPADEPSLEEEASTASAWA